MIRYTSLGEQSQYDWSLYRVMIGEETVRVYIYLYIHGFSRYMILDASLRQDQISSLDILERSMIESGGVPVRIQTDNAKVFVDKSGSGSQKKLNDQYLHFSVHYGFQPSRSLPGHPWSKGKVEKPFQYVENHFIQGNKFESFEDLLIKLKEFQDIYNGCSSQISQ